MHGADRAAAPRSVGWDVEDPVEPGHAEHEVDQLCPCPVRACALPPIATGLECTRRAIRATR